MWARLNALKFLHSTFEFFTPGFNKVFISAISQRNSNCKWSYFWYRRNMWCFFQSNLIIVPSLFHILPLTFLTVLRSLLLGNGDQPLRWHHRWRNLEATFAGLWVQLGRWTWKVSLIYYYIDIGLWDGLSLIYYYVDIGLWDSKPYILLHWYWVVRWSETTFDAPLHGMARERSTTTHNLQWHKGNRFWQQNILKLN